ncbi:Arm DNA-binding domain-containing protein [Caulobacter sp. CCH9-E1]|nr:Arm DNA-binding domain-containing protein [Caulobacter sp. CCH9-E1]
MYADGGGLNLCVQTGGAKSWVYRYMLNGRAREMGLGPAGTASLS